MPGPGRMGGPMGRGFLTEEEKQNKPKVTKELLLRVYGYLKPYWKQMLLVQICIVISSLSWRADQHSDRTSSLNYPCSG